MAKFIGDHLEIETNEYTDYALGRSKTIKDGYCHKMRYFVDLLENKGFILIEEEGDSASQTRGFNITKENLPFFEQMIKDFKHVMAEQDEE